MAGDGINRWLFKTARLLHAHFSPEQIIEILTSKAANRGRVVTTAEIIRAVECSWPDPPALVDVTPVPSVTRKQPAWPEANLGMVDRVVRGGFGLRSLKTASSVPCGGLSAPRVVSALFVEDPWLCCGKSLTAMMTHQLSRWGGTMSECRYIVPSPMTGPFGFNQAGEPSPRCLANTGPRTYLVIECDFARFARDGKTPTKWHDLIAAWERDGITVIDACAAVLWFLAQGAPLVLAVYSGNKSLHGWFACRGVPEDVLLGRMRDAVTLGADPATWVPCQPVRRPCARRADGRFQYVCYWDPETAMRWATC